MTPSTVTLTLRRGLTAPDREGWWLARLRDGTWHMVDVQTRTGELVLSDLMVVDCDEEDRDLIPIEHVVEFCGPLPSEPPEAPELGVLVVEWHRRDEMRTCTLAATVSWADKATPPTPREVCDAVARRIGEGFLE